MRQQRQKQITFKHILKSEFPENGKICEVFFFSLSTSRNHQLNFTYYSPIIIFQCFLLASTTRLWLSKTLITRKLDVQTLFKKQVQIFTEGDIVCALPLTQKTSERKGFLTNTNILRKQVCCTGSKLLHFITPSIIMMEATYGYFAVVRAS